MQVLFNSIYAKFKEGSTGTGTLYDLLDSHLHFSEAPQGTAYPYGVYHLITNVPSWTFDADMENYIIQFNLFDDDSSSTVINTAFKALTKEYDWCDDLNTSGYSNIYMKRELSSLTRESDTWNYMIQYRIEVQKSST
ncbi:hypothetical protein ES705_36139 [subsurface metagenome]